MFDRTVILPNGPLRTEYVTREVHEHRAPTDDSVKLLREMERAAEAKLIASLTLDSNALKGVIHVWHDDASRRVLARAVFDLNGRRCTANADVSPTADSWHKVELMQRLHDAIAKVVAAEILGDGMKGLSW